MAEIVCEGCAGRGHRCDDPRRVCFVCQGTGAVTERQRAQFHAGLPTDRPRPAPAAKRTLTLDEQIEGERETIFYTSAPQAVKDEARSRLKTLLQKRSDRAAGAAR